MSDEVIDRILDVRDARAKAFDDAADYVEARAPLVSGKRIGACAAAAYELRVRAERVRQGLPE